MFSVYPEASVAVLFISVASATLRTAGEEGCDSPVAAEPVRGAVQTCEDVLMGHTAFISVEVYWVEDKDHSGILLLSITNSPSVRFLRDKLTGGV